MGALRPPWLVKLEFGTLFAPPSNALSSLIFRSDCSEDTRTECAPKQLSIWAGDPPDNTWEITDSLYSTNQCEVSFINHIIFGGYIMFDNFKGEKLILMVV